MSIRWDSGQKLGSPRDCRGSGLYVFHGFFVQCFGRLFTAHPVCFGGVSFHVVVAKSSVADAEFFSTATDGVSGMAAVRTAGLLGNSP